MRATMNRWWLANSKTPDAIAARSALILVTLLIGCFWRFHSPEAPSSPRIREYATVPNGALDVDAADLDFGESWENETSDEGRPFHRTICLRNPTSCDVLIEKFEHPCGVAHVADRRPVKVPANGQAEINVAMCPQRLMTFHPDKLSVAQRMRIRPVISAFPGEHPGWEIRRTVRAAMLAPSKATFQRLTGSPASMIKFDLTCIAECEQIDLEYDHQLLQVTLEPKSRITRSVTIQRAKNTLPLDFLKTVRFHATLSDGKHSSHLLDVTSSVP